MKQKLHIRSHNGSYMKFDAGEINFEGQYFGESEGFSLSTIPIEAKTIKNGDQVHFLTSGNRVISLSSDNTLRYEKTPGPITFDKEKETRFTIPDSFIGKEPLRIKIPGLDPNKNYTDRFTVVIPPGQGDTLNSLTKFGLRASNGKFLSAEDRGGGKLRAVGIDLGDCETFTANFSPPPSDMMMTIYFRTADGHHFLQAEKAGGGELHTKGTLRFPFVILAANRESVNFPDNALVHISTGGTKYYLSATNGGGSTITATAKAPGEFETFKLILPPGVATLVKGGKFSLQTKTGHFISAISSEGGLTATSTKFDDLKTFTFAEIIEPIPDVNGAQGNLNVTITGKAELGEKTSEETPDVYPEPNFVCTTRTTKITETFSEAMLLDPQSDVVYPGALIDGAHWATGEYKPVTDARAPLTLSFSLQDFSGKPVTEYVNNPTLSGVREALARSRKRLLGTTMDARIQSEILEIHSKEHLQFAMKGSIDTGTMKLAHQFDFSDTKATNKILFRYIQLYYTADVDLPSRGADLFANKRLPTSREMLISSVTYGRMLLIGFETYESIMDINAAVNFAYKPYKLDENIRGKYDSIFRSTKTSMMALGGQAALAQPILLSGGLEDIIKAIKDFIISGDKFNDTTGAVPLSYRMRFLKDFSIGNICLSTSFVERRCVQSTGRLTIKNITIMCVKESDPGEKIELYGWIRVKAGADGDEEVKIDASNAGDVWVRDKNNYESLAEKNTFSVNEEPRFTFHDFYKHKDSCYVEVSADFWERDDLSSDDHIYGDSKKFYITDLPVNQTTRNPYGELTFRGDGNEVKISFDFTLH